VRGTVQHKWGQEQLAKMEEYIARRNAECSVKKYIVFCHNKITGRNCAEARATGAGKDDGVHEGEMRNMRNCLDDELTLGIPG